ncbi:hypothetical protein [Streptomyces spinoverrucosus]|uniref:hypothetical protein n=1 Tax=Streptomyces spinoverrucosus TaxID=284043 RepID=UPI0018C37B81|nr:hypothetical protein [Streptomyces spinoverrucosus]
MAVRAGSNQAKRAEIDRLCTEVPQFRQAFVRMSAAWGVGLLLEAVLRVPLVYVLSTDVMTGLSVVLLLTVIGLLSAWTASYANRVQSRYADARGTADQDPAPAPTN